MGFETAGKVLLILGIIVAILGLILIFADRIPFAGRLPGDILMKRDNVSVYFPLAPSIILSVLLTVVLNAVLRIIRR